MAMVGSTGVGKTTTAVKLAGRFARQHGRNQVALITMDDFRVGQREQLMTLAGSLGLSVQAAGNRRELQQALDSVAGRKLVILDTAGVNQRDVNLQDHFAELLGVNAKVRPYLVMSATAQESVLSETIRAFAKLKPAAAIVTKTDEITSIGAVLSSLIRYRLPVSYVGTGQGIPGDLAYATRDFFIRKLHESCRDAIAQLQRQQRAAG
jgi:flagellar biosynthesis protein FlhF